MMAPPPFLRLFRLCLPRRQPPAPRLLPMTAQQQADLDQLRRRRAAHHSSRKDAPC